MKIVIEQTVSKLVTEKLELDKPTFYKIRYGGYLGIYSAEKVVTVYSTPNYASAIISDYKNLSGTNPVFEYEITEEEFNGFVSKAIEMISANQLQTA
jgi:hypothetical protein